MVTRLVGTYLADFPLVSLVGIFSIVLQWLRTGEFVVAGRRRTDVPLARNLSCESRNRPSHLVDLTEHYYTRESSLGVSRNSGMEHVDT
jgi:hypothetical protein